LKYSIFLKACGLWRKLLIKIPSINFSKACLEVIAKRFIKLRDKQIKPAGESETRNKADV